jgi:ubiquinone/menaquinone biosynthesis C-methylase UbiE
MARILDAMKLRRRRAPDTSTTARFWANRHVETPEVWPAHWESRSAAYRSALAERLCVLGAESFLEVGCGCGPNLWALAQRSPGAQLAGIDVSDTAIRYGRQVLAEEDVNAQLQPGMAHELPYASDQFEVAFTCGVLVCLGPDTIESALSELLRVSRRAVLLLEGGSLKREEEDPYPNTMYWRRDYAQWLRELAPDQEVRVVSVPHELVHGHLDTYFELVSGHETTNVIRSPGQ